MFLNPSVYCDAVHLVPKSRAGGPVGLGLRIHVVKGDLERENEDSRE